MSKFSFDYITSYIRKTGFVYQGSEIYGGLANTWDYGPLGSQLKDNLKQAWKKKFIQENRLVVGLDSAILMNPKVWEASGHLTTFNDPLMDCRKCRSRFRADNLIEDFDKEINPSGWSNKKMEEFIKEHEIKCPNCGSHDFTDIRQFQLMFKTFQGVVEDASSVVYLRPETAQGIFVNFKNIQRSTRKKLPFGVAQIGKSFRNEITPGNFIFRTREFEQMELEFFCQPGEDLKWYEYWKDYCINFLYLLGIKKENLRLREHSQEELAFYSKGTCDIEYLYPFGWGELWGIADRTDYDLKQHMEHSKESFEYLDPYTNERYIPYCVEPSLGVDRLTLAIMCEAYDEETLENGDTRIVMRLHPYVAPYKVAVLPLSKQLNEKAIEVLETLNKDLMCDYDETGSIGKRYRRQDGIGTPYCVTVDFDTLEDESVTIRERDSMEQIRVKISNVKDYLLERIKF
ncbi:TPA: glycine--tRNA ligase [bacterium]|nr:glycine--tRNA ligase [bacterium]